MIINEAEFSILTLLASRAEVKWTWYNLDRTSYRYSATNAHAPGSRVRD